MLFRRGTQKLVGLDEQSSLLEFLGIDPLEVKVRGKNALKVSVVYSCIRILSESIAKLPLKVYRASPDGTKKAQDHYLYRLLKLRPNPYMSSSDFFRCMESQRNMHGNAYANIETYKAGDKKGQIKALWPMDASKVSIWIDDKGITGSKLWYVVNVNGEEKRLWPDEVLHFKSLTTDGIVGIPPLEALRISIENAAYSEEYINNFFKKGLQAKGIIHYTGELSEENERKFIKVFEAKASGLDNSHRIAMLPYGFQFQPISVSMADAQFLENSELTIRQIAAAFGIKMHQLNDLERATYANSSEQQRQFYVDTLMPILTAYEQEMTYKLFVESELEQGYYCKFAVDAITRADIKTRYEAYRIGIQGGFLKPNEVRDWEELEPEEGGDKLFGNGNIIPLKMAGMQYRKDGGSGSGEGNQNNTEPSRNTDKRRR